MAGIDESPPPAKDAQLPSTLARDDEVAASYVAKSLFDANTVLKADSDNTPLALAVPASTVLGRKGSGGITAMTPAEARAVLGIGEVAFVELAAAQTVAGDNGEHAVATFTTGNISPPAGDYELELMTHITRTASAYVYVRLRDNQTGALLEQAFGPDATGFTDAFPVFLKKKITLDGNVHTFAVSLLGNTGTIGCGYAFGGNAAMNWLRLKGSP